jgi:hypothetical protein
MEHYVTLFDSLFLPQGLALLRSLERHAGTYRLWVLCIDVTALEVLRKLNLPNVALIPLAEVETPELRHVKPLRTSAEYCWTLTPFAPGFVFDRDASIKRVTYLDADVSLVQDPAPVFAEFSASSKSVLITEHAYAPEHDQTAQSGRYCVQFMTFQRDRGEVVRLWWAERCLEWCYARVENGKFGDQKYLDDWLIRFADEIHVARNRAQFLAPWNVARFAASEAVVFHFQGLRLLRGRRIQIAHDLYDIPLPTMQLIYQPYLKDLAWALAALDKAGFQAQPQIDRPVLWLRLSSWMRRLFRWGVRLAGRSLIRRLGA